MNELPGLNRRARGQVVAVIPARFASTRLPGKPLLRETGQTLIQHVVEAAMRATTLDRVIVATDDLRIVEAVEGFGGEAVMTRDDHPSGSDRVAEVAARLDDAELIVNLQGDEPSIAGSTIDCLVRRLRHDPEASMATLATPIHDPAVFHDPGCVKAVLGTDGRALYFSRSPIPYHRDHPGYPDGSLGLLHLGLYAYRRPFLLELAQWPPSPLEQAEKLEQLRVLEAGRSIAVGVVTEHGVGIDTPDDYARFVDSWRRARGAVA